MSKLKELIDSLCKDGVLYPLLGDYIDIYTGQQFNKRDMLEVGPYPVLNGGINPSGYSNTYSEPENTIAISQGGASAGYVNFMLCKFFAGAHCYVVKPKDGLNNKYLYYFLKNLESKLMEQKQGAGIPSLNREKVRKLEIPVPPIEVQEEIVRILDNYTQLQAELQAELQARQEQYEYYRNKLLSFNEIGGGARYKYRPMRELGYFYGGLSGKSKQDFNGGNAKFINYMNVFNNISLNLDVEDRVKINEGEKQNNVLQGDVLFTGSSETQEECGMSSVVVSEPMEPLYLNSFCFGFRLNDKSTYNPDFLKHLLRGSGARKLIIKTAHGVTRYNVSKKMMGEIVLPIPSIPEQNRIAGILDRFESLTKSLNSGLPAEIEAVKEQYEYYRNKLLTFKRLSA